MARQRAHTRRRSRRRQHAVSPSRCIRSWCTLSREPYSGHAIAVQLFAMPVLSQEVPTRTRRIAVGKGECISWCGGGLASTSLPQAPRSTRAFRQAPRRRRSAFRRPSGETGLVRRKVAHTSSDGEQTFARRLERRKKRSVPPRRSMRSRAGSHGERLTVKRSAPRRVPPGQAEHPRRLGVQLPHRLGGVPHLRRTGAPPLQAGQ